MTSAGWSEYPDSSIGSLGMLGYLGAIGAMGSFAYAPNLGPVGSGASYYPGDTSADAAALNYLGFYPELYFKSHIGTEGSQKDDMADGAGAWDPTFQTAVKDFQASASGLTVDGWIGPKTRTALAAAVAVKNASAQPLIPPGPYTPPASPLPTPPAVIPPFVPNVPVGPSPSPVSPSQPAAAKSDNTLLYAGAAVGAAVLGLGAYYLLK